jgi:hypothetical protein
VDKALTLLDVLKSYAPNKDALLEIDRFYTTLVDNQLSKIDIERAIVRALADGLDHGNWLWGVYSTNDMNQ